MSKYSKLIVFHPSQYMVNTMDELIKNHAPEITYENIVVPDLLDEAMEHGLTEDLKNRVRKILSDVSDDPSILVLCSCSTYGGCSEEIGKELGKSVIRIDRPMAELAVKAGKNIGVAVALHSTIGPTTELLKDIAKSQNQEVHLKEIICESAWERKQTGDNDGYINEIVKTLEHSHKGLDAIVLAQGSMAPAAELCKGMHIPIFTSPTIAVHTIAKKFDSKMIT